MQLFKQKKGGIDMTHPEGMITMLIAVLFAVALIPTIYSSAADANGNFTGASLVLWGVVGIVIVGLFIVGLVKNFKR